MPERTRKRRTGDFAQVAAQVVAEATDEEHLAKPEPDEPEKNPAAVALGRLGGLKGGKARAAKLTSEQRRESARMAAARRWGKAPEAPRS
jgi:hypothetical protein